MRKILPIIAVSILLVLAGCSGPATSYSAPPGEVSGQVAEEHDYQFQSAEKFEYNKSITVNDQEYHIETTNWVSMYNKSETLKLGETNISTKGQAFYVIVSTPSVEFAGQQLNPLVSMPTKELLQQVTDRSERLEINEKVSEEKITHQERNQQITVKKYDAVFNMPKYNTKVNGYVLVSVFQNKNSVLVTVGAYPDQLKEEQAIKQLMANTTTAESPPTTK